MGFDNWYLREITIHVGCVGKGEEHYKPTILKSFLFF